MGAGALALGATAVFAWRGRSLANQVEAAEGAWTDELAELEGQGRTANRLALGLGVAGAGLVLGGAVLLWLGRPRLRVEVWPAIEPGSAGVTLGGRFDGPLGCHPLLRRVLRAQLRLPQWRPRLQRERKMPRGVHLSGRRALLARGSLSRSVPGCRAR